MPKKFQKNSCDFESIQFPSLHLEAENHFGDVPSRFYYFKTLNRIVILCYKYGNTL